MSAVIRKIAVNWGLQGDAFAYNSFVHYCESIPLEGFAKAAKLRLVEDDLARLLSVNDRKTPTGTIRYRWTAPIQHTISALDAAEILGNVNEAPNLDKWRWDNHDALLEWYNRIVELIDEHEL